MNKDNEQMLEEYKAEMERHLNDLRDRLTSIGSPGMSDRNEQLALDGVITCEKCYYGRDLYGGDYGCRSEKRRQLNKESPNEYKLVNKKDYTCDFAEAAYK